MLHLIFFGVEYDGRVYDVYIIYGVFKYVDEFRRGNKMGLIQMEMAKKVGL